MGYIIGFFSAKGGVGKSILTTNLGVAFGVGHQRKVVILDLNPGLGTTDLLLDLEPERNWGDLESVLGELTPKHIKLAVTEYRPGVDVLAPPTTLSWSKTITRENLSALLEALQIEYDFVLVDTPPGGGFLNKAAFSLVDLRLVVLTPDALSLRATKRYLEVTPEKDKEIGLVITQYTSGAAINPDEIKGHLEHTLYAVLPMDPSGVWANVSYGDPCVLRRSSKLGKSIRSFSARLLKQIDQWATQNSDHE